MTVNEQLGERVHQLMWRNGVTQAQIGSLLGCTQTAVSRKVHGDREFSISEVLLIAEYFNVPVTDLIAGITVTRQSLSSHTAPVVATGCLPIQRLRSVDFIPSQQAA